MMFLSILLVLFTTCAVGLITSSDSDLASLQNHVLQLEQTVSTIQSQLQEEEQKNAAVLSSVLSKLGHLTSELENMKSHSQNATCDNCLLLQMELKTLLADNKSKVALSDINNTINSVTFKEIQEVRSDLNVSKSRIDSVVTELASVKTELHVSMNNQTSFTSEVRKAMTNLNTTINSAEQGLHDLSSELKLVTSTQFNLTSELNNMGKEVNMLNESWCSGTPLSHKPKPQENIAFLVEETAHSVYSPGNTILFFSSLKYNLNNSYDINSGMFRAPQRGVYLFWINAAISSESVANITVHIKSETRQLGSAYGEINQREKQATVKEIVVAEVVKDERVWFWSTVELKLSNIMPSSSYGGVLLFPV